MKKDILEYDGWKLEDTTRAQTRQGESASLERDNNLDLCFVLYTSLTLGEESGRANKFRGSSEVGRTIDNSAEPLFSSSSSNSRSSASESPDSSNVSETWISSSSSGTGDGDGARLCLREAMNLVLEELGEHGLAVSALLCLSLSTTLTGRSGGYRGGWVQGSRFRNSRSGEWILSPKGARGFCGV